LVVPDKQVEYVLHPVLEVWPEQVAATQELPDLVYPFLQLVILYLPLD